MENQISEQLLSPFAEKIDINRFFPVTERDVIFEEMQTAIIEAESFLTLIGDEGSGKTLFCKVIQSNLPANVLSIYLPSIIESFEDVLQLVVQEVGVSFSQEDEKLLVRDKLQIIKKHLEESGQKILIIFDEAESIYLATLERARKMLDQVNCDGKIFTILFAGRHTLQDHLRQLSMCNFEPIAEKHFTLAPISRDETAAYLNHTIKSSKLIDKHDVFTYEACEKIYDMALGNFRMTNILAEEALHNVNSDTSFLVLLDNIRDAKDEKVRVKRRINSSFSWLKDKKNIKIGGGVLASILVVVLIFSGGKDEEVVVPKPIEKKTTIQEQTKKNMAEEVPKKKAVVKIKTPDPEPVIKEVSVPKEIEKPVEVVKAPEKKVTPVVEKTIEKTDVVVEKKTEKIKEVVVENPAPEKKPVKIDLQYDERVRAGISWMNGKAKDKFTVQLMVLTSETAEQNLRTMLQEDDYNEVLDEMYILHKSGADSPILVFYGEYPTMSAARNARNTLPQVLRKHHPYAISIEGAVEKAK